MGPSLAAPARSRSFTPFPSLGRGAGGATNEGEGDGGHPCARVAFQVQALIAHRHLVLNMVSALLSYVEAADRQFHDEMITAFGEAFNNIVTHGYFGRSDGMIDVVADLRADEVTIRLMDTGLEVDFASVVAPDLDSMPEGGMGVFMIRALVDEVTYQGGAVNVLSLTKRTSSREDAALR
jgi:serine/threonine-protein kinase RsbW